MRLEHKKKPLPINLARKATRERRIRNGGVGRNRKKNKMKRLRRGRKQDFEFKEIETLANATETHLKDILENDEQLSDIPFDVTPEELQGEVNSFGVATSFFSTLIVFQILKLIV